MKVTKEVLLANSKRRITVELAQGERLVAIKNDAFYRLSEPFDDVIRGYHISDGGEVTWDALEQRWVA